MLTLMLATEIRLNEIMNEIKSDQGLKAKAKFPSKCSDWAQLESWFCADGAVCLNWTRFSSQLHCV